MTKSRDEIPSLSKDKSSSDFTENDSTKSKSASKEEIISPSSIKNHANIGDENGGTSGTSSSSSSDDDDDDISVSETQSISLAEIRHAVTLSTQAASKKFGWKNDVSHEVNELTSFIPGYTAPMSLDSSALDVHKLSSLTKCVFEKTPDISTNWTKSFKHQSHSSLLSQKSKTNAGEDWFGMEATPNSASLAADIAVIRNRTYLDPKRFYKSSEFKKGKDIGVVQLGTVVEGAMESIYTNRLTKKQRKGTVMEEVMGEVFEAKDDYVKKTYGKIQRKKIATSQRSRRGKEKRMKFK